MTLPDGFLERLAAAAAQEGLLDAAYSTFDSRLGQLLVAQSPLGVCAVTYLDHEADTDTALADIAGRIGPRIVRSRDETRGVREQLEAYLEGDAVAFDLPVDLRLVHSPFQRDVLTELQRVPRGEVTTYGTLSARIGRPRAVRATGTALGRNPIPIIVPCHRVLPTGGALGFYSAGDGPATKAWLLKHERAEGWLL